MTPARRTARACRTIAGISATSALVSAAWHPWYAIPGLLDTRGRVRDGGRP